MTSTQETIVLDCNRLSSTEYVGGNNTSKNIFTNKIGSGISVKQGDRVSVHNSFISAVGQAEGSIEISDKFIENRQITYTEITNHSPINGCNEKPFGYERQTAENKTETIQNNGNSTSIFINYYKNANGENCFPAPRRFYVNDATIRAGNLWDSYDTISEGRQNGESVYFTQSNASQNDDNLSIFICPDDQYRFQGSKASASNVNDCFKQIQDNSRFKMYIATDTRFGTQTDGDLDDLINASFYSPAMLDYIEYIEKIDLSVDKGFQSADSISKTLTDQLRKNTQPQVMNVISTANFNTGIANLQTLRPTNLEISSPTFHTFYCAGQFTSNEEKSASWADAVENDTGDDKGSNTYLSTYQFIGIKRPDLWDAGVNFINTLKARYIELGTNPNLLSTKAFVTFNVADTISGSFFRRDNASAGNHTITTSLRWELYGGVMKAMSNIFKEQAKHPELFKNTFNQLRDYTNVNNSRFIHMNIHGFTRRNAIAGGIYKFTLGHDYLDNNGSGFSQLGSFPFFFDYNPAYADIETDGLSWETGYSYGAFKKVRRGGLNYVAFTTSHLGIIENASLPNSFTTIPNCVFTDNRSSASFSIESQTRLGWDSHFSAYGNSVLQLCDGYSILMKNNDEELQQLPTGYSTTQIETNEYINRVYLGADNPSINFNTTSRKFEILDLHTSERIQNRYNAGGVASASKHTEFIVPTFPTEGQKVYKINKRLFDTNFTPAMMPYSANRNTNIPVNGENYQVDFLNPNLRGWSIYDQYCGIIIKDFGYSQDKWDDGLWATLGFSYEQFNAPRTSSNDLTNRIGNENKDALPYALTNSIVGQEQIINFPTNIWGAGMYSLQVPLTMSLDATNSGGHADDYQRENLKFEVYPAISEPATSVVLSATNLPKRVQQGYYLIKSDVLDNSQYHLGDDGQSLQIVEVIDKVNDTNDFFVGGESSLEFTFTKPKTISSIKTEILNPDGTPAEVGDNSGVIYKINRVIPNNLDIVSQILQEGSKQKNKS